MKQPAINPTGSRSDGIFRDHIGAGGSSIWAAATSGGGAIAAHLLASMWTRYKFDAAEARCFIRSIWEYLLQSRSQQVSVPSDHAYRKLFSFPWLPPLVRAIEDYEQARGSEKESLAQLMALGSCQGSILLGPQTSHPAPLFGLADCETLFNMLDGPEARVKVLRYAAEMLDLLPEQMIIPYKVLASDINDEDITGRSWYEYATATLRKETIEQGQENLCSTAPADN